jgi:hypothetical protein
LLALRKQLQHYALRKIGEGWLRYSEQHRSHATRYHPSAHTSSEQLFKSIPFLPLAIIHDKANAGGGHQQVAALVAAAGDAFALAVDRLALSFSPAVASVLEQLLRAWSFLAVPLLRGAVTLCMAMSVMVLAEKVFLGSVSAAANVFRRRRRRLGTETGVRGGVHPAVPLLWDEEAGGGTAAFPMVLVQIPMYNEREVGNATPARLTCYLILSSSSHEIYFHLSWRRSIASVSLE